MISRWGFAAFFLLVGLLAGLRAGLFQQRLERTLHPVGYTPAAVVTPEAMCQRGTPPDVAAECLAELGRGTREARLRIAWSSGVAVASLAVGCGLLAYATRQARRSS